MPSSNRSFIRSSAGNRFSVRHTSSRGWTVCYLGKAIERSSKNHNRAKYKSVKVNEPLIIMEPMNYQILEQESTKFEDLFEKWRDYAFQLRKNKDHRLIYAIPTTGDSNEEGRQNASCFFG
jgi:hypothetical protein